jgi:hypothetical protein
MRYACRGLVHSAEIEQNIYMIKHIYKGNAKLGVSHHLDFQGQRSMLPGQIFTA